MNYKIFLILFVGHLFIACHSKPAIRTPSAVTHQCVPARGNFAQNDQLHVSATQQISNTQRTSGTIHIARAQNGCRFYRLDMPAISISTIAPEDILTILGIRASSPAFTVYLESASQQKYRVSCTLPNRSRSEMTAIALETLGELGLQCFKLCRLPIKPLLSQIHQLL